MPEIRRHYWALLAQQHDPSSWGVLNAAYQEAQRSYHAWNHIDDLLRKLDDFREISTRPDLIATAIFWHDAVYATRGPDGSFRPDAENVQDSEALFRRHTLLPPAEARAVGEMIMATARHLEAEASTEYYPGFAKDLDLFLDLDLSPLAEPWQIFSENLDKIRFEYAWVPKAVFCLGRLEMLDRFAEPGVRLYRREETSALWLEAARDNISRTAEDMRRQLEQLSARS